jgi:hypothetical protein
MLVWGCIMVMIKNASLESSGVPNLGRDIDKVHIFLVDGDGDLFISRHSAYPHKWLKFVMFTICGRIAWDVLRGTRGASRPG